MNSILPNALMPRIRSIDVNKKGDKMLIGTFGSEIYEIFAVG